MTERLRIQTRQRGLHEITDAIEQIVDTALDGAGAAAGLCTVFVRHTSASLIVQENADPSARRDLEAWLDRLVPPHDTIFTHTAEGPDDMPSHIKASLTGCSLAIPIIEGRLGLGTWQGIYLWEHRDRPHVRELIVHVQ